MTVLYFERDSRSGRSEITLTMEENERLLESAVAMIKGLDGVKGLRERLAETHAVWQRIEQERETLLNTYPSKWVAMSKDGVVAADDSLEGVFARVDAQGMRRSAVKVKFFDAQPKTLIL